MFRNKWVLTGLSALLFNLSFLVPSLSFLIWIAFIPLFQLIYVSCSLIKTALFSAFIGFAFFAGLFYWIHKYEFRILILVLSFAAPYFAIFSLIVTILQKKFNSEIVRIFIPGLVWSFVNLLYALTPVESLGDLISFYEAARFPGLVRIIGTSGITFLILLMNSFIFHAIKTKKLVPIAGLLIIICLLALVIARNPEGTMKQSHSEIASALPGTPPRNDGKITVALIQHNFPIDPVWRNENKQKIMNYYEGTIRNLSNHVDLIIFPQYGLPVDVLRTPDTFQNLINQTKTSVLLATYLPKIPGGSLDSGERTDSALLFAPEKPVQEYQAVTPPPFRRIGQIRGTDRKVLLLNQIPIGVMLCYEDVRPEESKIWIQKGSQLLVSLSNPGHFLNTHLPDYHFANDRLRAIETGRYIVRVSPNGFSGIIDPNGKVLLKSQLGTAEILKGSVYPTQQQTIFNRLPISIHIILAGIFLIVAGAAYARDSMKRLALKMR